MSTNLFMFFVFTFVSLTILSAIVEGHTGLETTDLTAGISKTSTTISVKTTAPFADRGQLMIGDETICYTGKNSVQFTGVTRGEDCRRYSEAQAFPAGQQVMVAGTGVVKQLVGFDILSAFFLGKHLGLPSASFLPPQDPSIVPSDPILTHSSSSQLCN